MDVRIVSQMPNGAAPAGIPLPGFRAKLVWARELFEILRQVYDAYILSRPYELAYAAYPAEGEGRFRIRRVREQPPYQIHMLAGDIAHNARTALDHLLFALAKLHSPTAGDTAWSGVIWPIHTKRTAQASVALRGRLSLLPLDVQERVEQLQPYNVRRTASNPVIDRVRLSLGRLHALDRMDRHRELNLTFMGTGSLLQPPDLPAPYVAERGTVNMGPIAPMDAEFASWRFAGDVPDSLPAELDIGTYVPLGLCFPDLVIGSPVDQLGQPGSYGLLVYDLVNTLALCIESVEQATRLFLPCFRGEIPASIQSLG